MEQKVTRLGAAGEVARAFVNSPLTPLIVLASLMLGVMAIIFLPREEEPQIRVPMIDVMVSMPGASAKEIENRVTSPMEKLLWEIPGVEYIYSTSKPDKSLVIVRFKVGEDVENSLVRLNQKLQSNFDRIPHGVSFPLIKPRSIDDVPILALTLHSKIYDHLTLRRTAAQLEDVIKEVPNVAETTLIGGALRRVRVLLDPDRLAARELSLVDIKQQLQQANSQYIAGTLINNNREMVIGTGGFLETIEDVGRVVVGVFADRPVYLRDVADLTDSAEELSQYVFFGRGAGSAPNAPDEAAVTISIAKRPGANAITVADHVIEKVKLLRPEFLPKDLEITVTRNYGETAAEKSNELLFHMLLAVIGVSLLILLILGSREAIVVAVAIPTTLALTLLVFYLSGYTLNRITLFALIFSIGILVDDAIVVIENIVRCRYLPENKDRPFSAVAIEAVNEVGNPTILATLAVIAAILPMAFVGGLMGPYMRPIPIGASAAMVFSLAIAFIVTPWTAVRTLAKEAAHGKSERSEDRLTKFYRRVMNPLISSRRSRFFFLATIGLLLVASLATVLIGWVKVKMLPFDNKSEFQVILNMPEDSSLERTTEAVREIALAIRSQPEVLNYQIYSGTASPFNFNGLVRHYFLRQQASMADIQVNLLPKKERSAQSHEIAKRVRPLVQDIAKKYHARLAVAEVPPGPPVLQTLVAEIYGPTEESRTKLAEKTRAVMLKTAGVVDVDSYLEEDSPLYRFVIDKEKAALHGISAERVSEILKTAVGGIPAGLLHNPREKEDIEILLEVPRFFRTTPEALLGLRVRSTTSVSNKPQPLIPLRELVTIQKKILDKAIYHKNLMPVSYVIADVAGVIESPVYAIQRLNEALRENNAEEQGPGIEIYNAVQPFTNLKSAIKWDGEWQITIEVFRDLGLAFVAVILLIYILMVGWFSSFLTPAIVMAAIPFSLVGILPAHGALGAFFTATSMIGFMAGAGIVVRNSIILVDFIELRVQQGLPLEEAVVDAGAVRFRPMLLTALAVVVGAGVILFDPIFQGLALSLIAGEIASLLISRMAVPVLYYASKIGR